MLSTVPNSSEKGCGDFMILKKMSVDKMLRVFVNQQKTAFSTNFQVFDQIQNESFAQIELEQNDEFDKIWAQSCNDVAEDLQKPSVIWTLLEGKLSYKVSKVIPNNHCMESYAATVILENAKFKNSENGEIVAFSKIEMNNVFVGWCAG
jgi:hypothetical protein